MQVGVLFADIRGFTAFSDRSAPAKVAEGLTRFYSIANATLTADDALVEFVGDQVMALYLPAFPSLRENTPQTMVSAAQRLMAAIEIGADDDTLRVGVGIHMGVASVGNVEKGGMKDFTAVGDVVNTAARLQSRAEAGEIVISDEVFRHTAGGYPEAREESFDVKGKPAPVHAFVIGGAAASS